MRIARLFTQGEDRLSQLTNSNAYTYLIYLIQLEREQLIVPSVYRVLTEEGQKKVEQVFGSGLEARTEELIHQAQYGRLIGEGGKAPKLAEMDAFVYEIADLLFIDNEKNQNNPRENYVLGAIAVVHKGIEKGLLEINPQGCPHNQCYLGYRGK